MEVDAEGYGFPEHQRTVARLIMAALGPVAGDLIGKELSATLLGPMAEALPWLLPDQAPA